MESSLILTEKTLVDRQLVATTVLIGNTFGLVVTLFASLILSADFRSNRAMGFVTNPAVYTVSQNYAFYFLTALFLSAIIIGGILLLYQSITISTLCLYHFTFGLLTILFILHAILVLSLAHGNNSYSVFTHIFSASI